ncbi:MAG: hypothetical protein ACLP29_02080, partial [Dissulfurispiraceae bacterium]
PFCLIPVGKEVKTFMKVEFTKSRLVVSREEKDPAKFYSESTLLHHIKRRLIAMGFDVIKKLMWKDGHMVADTCHYIRSRKYSDDNFFMAWDGAYALRFLYEDWNKHGELSLDLENSK